MFKGSHRPQKHYFKNPSRHTVVNVKCSLVHIINNFKTLKQKISIHFTFFFLIFLQFWQPPNYVLWRVPRNSRYRNDIVRCQKKSPASPIIKMNCCSYKCVDIILRSLCYQVHNFDRLHTRFIHHLCSDFLGICKVGASLCITYISEASLENYTY